MISQRRLQTSPPTQPNNPKRPNSDPAKVAISSDSPGPLAMLRPMRARSATTTGILCLLAGVAIFSVQDLILKRLSGDYPLHQAMVLRSLTALPFLLLIVRLFDGRLTTISSPGWPKMLARGLLAFIAYAAYYLGLAALPMATTVALYFTGPLFITLAAALILGDRISTATAIAILAGFCGVLLMVIPAGDGFRASGLGWAALLPIAGAAGYALTMVLARPLGRTETAAAMAFWGNICFLACALVLSAIYGTGAFQGSTDPSLDFMTRGWIMPSPTDLALMASCGIIAAIGLTLLTQAYRIAPSASVAPFEYSFMFWAVLWGWLFLDELPTQIGWLGIAVIVAAGLYVIRAEGRPSGIQGSAPAQIAAEADRQEGPAGEIEKAAPEGAA